MITRDIAAYMTRDWEAARRSKDSYWAERIRRLGAAEGFRIAGELRLEMLLLDPTWPHGDERRDDLAHHVRLRELMQRADRPGRG
jgi:hypothetical protein